jgi:hypothetical protein
MECPNGVEGIDEDPENPYTRSIRRLLNQGKPDRVLTACFFGDDLVGSTFWRWIGVFAHTTGGRVIFFPGFSKPSGELVHFRTNTGSVQGETTQFTIDHVTLESDFSSTHFTDSSGRKLTDTSGRTGMRTAPLGDERFLWFGLSVANLGVLRTAKRQTIAQTKDSVNTADSERRLQELSKLTVSQPITLPHRATRQDEGFLHLTVIVGPRGFVKYHGPLLNFPHSSGLPLLQERISAEVLKDLPIRYHTLHLTKETDLQLTCAWLPGRLKGPSSFTVGSC